MVYFGSRLDALRGSYSSEPALIDPALPVNFARPNHSGDGMGYWPSYASISPESRAAYLDWLRAGRYDASAYIGYVFLFYYGLERRFFVDCEKLPDARAERSMIFDEVKRLASIYGGNHSFGGYASRFIAAAEVLLRPEGGPPLHETLSPPERGEYGWSPALLLCLAELVQQKKPIPPRWALAMVLTDPNFYPRTPAQRCRPELEALFVQRYHAAFREGFIAKSTPKRLRLTYQPASASFGGALEMKVSLPDVTSLEFPVSQWRTLVEECTNELDAYSRWLGRNPEGRGSLAAVGLLPSALLADQSAALPLQQALNRFLGGAGTAVLEPSELLTLWSSTAASKGIKGDAVAFIQALERLGYGVEPDVRFGGPRIDTTERVVLFRLPDASPSAPSTSYDVATLTLHLASAVSGTGDDVTPEEKRHLEQHVAAALHLTEGERARLEAHLQWLLAAHPGLNGLKKRIDGLDASSRRQLGQFLISVAAADGTVDPGELKTIGKIYKLLELDTGDLYARVHATMTAPAAREPVTVRPAGNQAAGFAIPTPKGDAVPGPGPGFNLDFSVIEARLQETRAVSALLSGIFVDEEQPAEAPKPSSVADESVAGLSPGNSRLLRRLGERSSWARSDLEVLAGELGLMLDGALEAINDAGYEQCDGPVWEGDDPVDIDRNTWEELCR